MDEESVDSYAHQTVRRVRDLERAAPDRRLPLPSYVGWPSFPYEGDLRVRRVDDVVLPEPAREGEGGVDCSACAAPDEAYVWTDADWRLRSTDEPTGLPLVLLLEPRVHADLPDLPVHLRADMGALLCRVEAAVSALGGIGRVHVSRIGDGGEHLHWWFMARPARIPQLLGNFAAIWDDILPPTPEDVWRENLDVVARELARA
jgi:diadenosine tetraphosphate (Ap4A) HIT family hydrolase